MEARSLVGFRNGLVISFVLWAILLAACTVWAADVKVEKVGDSTTNVKVIVTPPARIIRDTVDINQIDKQKKQMEVNLAQLNDLVVINTKRQEAIAQFDKNIETQKATLTENIKVYEEILKKADLLGVKITAEKPVE